MKKSLAALGFSVTGVLNVGFTLLMATLCWTGSGRGLSSLSLSMIAGFPLGIPLGAGLGLLAVGLFLLGIALFQRNRPPGQPEPLSCLIAGVTLSVTGALAGGFLLLALVMARVGAGLDAWFVPLQIFANPIQLPGLAFWGQGLALTGAFLLEATGLILLTAALPTRRK